MSAVRDEQVDVLVDLLVGLLPAGPALYPEGELTDEPEQVLVAELIREAALEGVREELPHSLAVTVEEMLRASPIATLTDIHANIYVERPSQKAIVIGSGGSRLREVGTTRASTSRRCLARRCSSTCASRSPRTGSVTPSSSAASASDHPPHNVATIMGSRQRHADERFPGTHDRSEIVHARQLERVILADPWFGTYFGGDASSRCVVRPMALLRGQRRQRAVAVRLDDDGRLETCAPFGLDDLLGLVWRPNWRRISADVAARRLREKRPTSRWPGVHVVADEG